MILSDRDILKRIKKGSIIVKPFIQKNLQPSTLDLRLSEEVRVFDNWLLGVIDVKNKEDPSRVIKIPEKGFILQINKK
jgi:deoxycytidine triphosphate deaminase